MLLDYTAFPSMYLFISNNVPHFFTSSEEEGVVSEGRRGGQSWQ